MKFQDFPLFSNQKVVLLNREGFLERIIKILSTRLFDNKFTDLMGELSVLDKNICP